MVFGIETPLNIVPNFCEDFAAERERALSCEYKDIEHNNLKYRGISELSNDSDEKKIEKMLKLPPGKWTTFYRRYLEDEENETYIHTDADIGTISGILFLNTKEQCRGGVAFWMYKQYGWGSPGTKEQLEALGLDDTPLFWKKVYQDGFNEKRWEMIEYVPMQENTLLLFNSAAFHSRYPKKAFGTALGNARLIKTFFYAPSKIV